MDIMVLVRLHACMYVIVCYYMCIEYKRVAEWYLSGGQGQYVNFECWYNTYVCKYREETLNEDVGVA